MRFHETNLGGWNLEGQNLHGAEVHPLFEGTNLRNAVLTNVYTTYSGGLNLQLADLTGADTRGAENFGFSPNFQGAITTNMIYTDGSIVGLNLTDESHLLIRDHDGLEEDLGIPITVLDEVDDEPHQHARTPL